MADDAMVEAVIRFKAENVAAVTEAKAAIMDLNSGISNVNVTMGSHAAATNVVKTAERDLTVEANAAARAMGSLGEEGARVTERFTALGGLMGQGGALTAGIGGGILALGGLALVLEQIVHDSDEAARAENSLAQAYATQGQIFQFAGSWVQQFIQSNAQLISNQYDLENAIAQATRAGLDEVTVQRMAADALDISATTGQSYSQVMEGLLQLHAGNTRGLSELGFSATETNQIMGRLKGNVTDYNRVLSTLEQSYGGAAAAQAKTTGGANDLGVQWQTLTTKGSGLADMLNNAEGALADLLQLFNENTLAAKAFGDVIGGLLPALNGLGAIGSLLGGGSAGGSGDAFSGLVQAPDGSWYAPNGQAPSGFFSNFQPNQTGPFGGVQNTGGDNLGSAGVTINVYGSGDPQQAANLTAQQISTMYGR